MGSGKYLYYNKYTEEIEQSISSGTTWIFVKYSKGDTCEDVPYWGCLSCSFASY
jgi:hypothetical protein